jgi:hypothetical protein
MDRDQAHASDLSAVQSELTPPEAPRPGTPPALEQVVEHMSARYMADLRALSKELSQRVQTTERETLEAPPSELEHQQNTLLAQTESASTDVPGPETPVPHAAEVATSQSAETQQRQIAPFPEHFARSQTQHQTLSVLERLKELAILFWPWIFLVFLMGAVGVLLGISITLLLR